MPAAAGGQRGNRGERRGGPARGRWPPPPPWGLSHPQGIGGGTRRGAEQKAAEEENLLHGQRRAGTLLLPRRDQPCRGRGLQPRLQPNALGAIPAAGRARPAGSQLPVVLPVPASHPRCSPCRPANLSAPRAGRPSPVPLVPAIPGAPLGCVQFALLLVEQPRGPTGTAVTSVARAVGRGSPHQALSGDSCPSRPPHPHAPTADGWQGKRAAAGTATSCCRSDGRAGKESATTEPSAPSLASVSPWLLGAARGSARGRVKVGCRSRPGEGLGGKV